MTANLFWKRSRRVTSLLDTPFKTEEEFERTVFDTTELLDDIFLIRRQVRGGGKAGIPDIVGVDNDGNICILELKNVPVGPSIIPQVLEYAIWADANPDSIKSLWLELDDKPEDLAINWENFEVRIIVMAPTISRGTLQFVERINYPVELIEAKRWVEGDNQFIMINRLEPETSRRTRPARGMPTYDLGYYEKRYDKELAQHFFKYVEEVDQLVEEHGWNLDKKWNRNNCAFKAGFFNAFVVRFTGAKTFAFVFYVDEDEAHKLGGEPTKYNAQGKRAVYQIEPGKTKTRDLLPLFEAAYRNKVG